MHDNQDHYFSFSAFETLWENTHMMAESLTRSPSAVTTRTPTTTTTTPTKPPRSPPGRHGRPPLSPQSVLLWESVETVMSPRSIDDVRLLVVPAIPTLPTVVRATRQLDPHTSGRTSDINSHDCDNSSALTTDDAHSLDAHSLDFTLGTASLEALKPRFAGSFMGSDELRQQQQQPRETSDNTDNVHVENNTDDEMDEDEELVGLFLLRDETADASDAMMHLDLAFLKEDPPQAHGLRCSGRF